MPEYHPGTDVEILDSVPTSGFRSALPNVKRYMKPNRWEPSDVATAAYEGDFELLETLLATGDEMNLFNGDLNEHAATLTPLQLATVAGHTECVELLIRARADPHIRERMAYGQDPEDGRTALDLARAHEWDDCVELLEQAETQYPYGWYAPIGLTNNAKCYGCWEWGKKPEKGWYMQRPGAARKQGLDPKRYGVEELPEPEEELAPPALGAGVPTAAAAAAKSLPVGLLFPGQGSQYVKMMTAVKDIPAVREMLDKARSILGFDILPTCLDGSEEELAMTSVSQPAVFIAGLSAVERLRQDREEAVTNCRAMAGLSLGEFTALCAAGVFTFEDGLALVKLRSEAMQSASQASPQAQLSIAGFEKPRLLELCAAAERAEGAGAVCKIANELFPKGFLCTGTEKAIQELKDSAEKAGALQAKLLKTSGGIHTELMGPAQELLSRALDELLPRMKPPRCAVYMNATAAPIHPGTPPQEIVRLLKQQVTSPVLWEGCVRAMIKDGVTEFYEVGPMKQLKAMMKRIDAQVWNNTNNVEV